jgi:predicted nuclease with TOPRIM domain
MTDDESQGIYNVLNQIKEDVNELKINYTKNSSKLDSLSNDVSRLSKDHEDLRGIISTGNYGKNSLIEEVKISHSKINHIENRIDSIKDDVSILEQRWVKFLWAISILVLISAVSSIVNSQVDSDDKAVFYYNYLHIRTLESRVQHLL